MYLLFTFLILIGAFISLRTILVLRKWFKNRKILQVIPAPPERFFFGHLYILTENPELLFKRIRFFSNRYYPIYRFSTFYVSIVHILEPSDIELVLSSTKHLSKSIIYSFLYNWLGTGLLTSTGAKWHQRRKILTPAFHFTILQQFLSVFNDETEHLVKRLSQDINKSIDVIPPVTNFTLQSIAETAMGFSNIDDSTKTKYKNSIYQIGRILVERLRTPWYRFNFIYRRSSLGKLENQVVKVLHNISNTIILERETNFLDNYSKKKRLAMLDMLLTAKKEGADIDFEGIREEVDTFMFEGHDTTSMAISFLFLVFANLPEVQRKVLDEICSVVGTTKAPSYEELQNLKYTERVIKETLRLFPSVPFISRIASEDFVTKTGYKIPEGTILHVHIFDIHRNESIFANPLKFDPDRFLPENSQDRHPFAFIPFSAGPRNCIGQKFALLELKTVLCGILRNFKLEKVDDMYDIEFRPDLVLRPVKDVKVKILSRYDSTPC